MSSQEQREISAHASEVAKFYAGKSLLITGAAGFLGSVLLETLLRCCPDIHRIYILLRAKKGVKPEDRKEAIFKKEIFYKVRNDPEVLNKVVVVSGDVTHKDLGMCSEDTQQVCEKVSIVFHCAAAISFTKPLSFMVDQNVKGTNNVIELCKKLDNLDVLVYTSTAFSNCNQEGDIEEKFYKLPFTADEALEVLKNGSQEEQMLLLSKCEPPSPNHYVFTKCLAERLIAEKTADMTACVVRPSIIVCCMGGVLPGYVEDGSALVSLALGIGRGFIRVLRADGEKRTNHIPADVVANALIVAGYRQVAERLPSPFVYNCASDSWKWKDFCSSAFQMVVKNPLPNKFQEPSLILHKNPVKYWMASIFDHYAPAIVIDFLLWMSGRKLRLFKLYRFYDKCNSVTQYFMQNEWNFKTENFRSLGEKLNAVDKELFSVDLKNFTLEEITKVVPQGAPMYKKNRQLKKRQQSHYISYFTSLIKWFILGFIASVFYVAIF